LRKKRRKIAVQCAIFFARERDSPGKRSVRFSAAVFFWPLPSAQCATRDFHLPPRAVPQPATVREQRGDSARTNRFPHTRERTAARRLFAPEGGGK
jgi:hypothetical protein